MCSRAETMLRSRHASLRSALHQTGCIVLSLLKMYNCYLGYWFWRVLHGGKATSFLLSFSPVGRNVYRPPNQYIAPVQEPYGYIIFRASKVKDLSVNEPPPAQSQHNVPPFLECVRLLFFSFLICDEIISDIKTIIIRERKKHVEFSVAFLLTFFFFVDKEMFSWMSS